MKRLFAVTRVRGKAWDPNRPMRAQAQWPAHAEFMDDLATKRFVMLGGPLDVNEKKTLLIVDAADEAEIRSTLAQDPWSKSAIMEIQSIELWTVLLQAGPAIRVMPDPKEILGSIRS